MKVINALLGMLMFVAGGVFAFIVLNEKYYPLFPAIGLGIWCFVMMVVELRKEMEKDS